MTPNASEAGLRASDAERDQVAALLSKQVVAGRLTMGEFEARVDGAFAARTRGQLQQLTADLPLDAAAPELAARKLDPCLLFFLIFLCPPAALVYWLIMRSPAAPRRVAGDIAKRPARLGEPVLSTGGRDFP